MKKEQSDAAKKKPKTSAAQIRVQKGPTAFRGVNQYQELIYPVSRGHSDLTELELPSTMTTDFPDPADLLNFTLTIQPDEGAVASPQQTVMLCNGRLRPEYVWHRHVQGRELCVHVRHQPQLPPRTTKSEMHAKGTLHPQLDTRLLQVLMWYARSTTLTSTSKATSA